MLLVLVAVVAALYIAACAALVLKQRSFLYYPQPASFGTAADRMKLAVEGGNVMVSVNERKGPGAVLYFGGNAEDVSYHLPTMPAQFPDRAIYLMHYRGYGGSVGSPTQALLQQDALALFDYVQAEHPDVIVIGRSLGTGVAIKLATVRPVSRLVLVTPYDSIEALAASQFPMFPVSWLLQDKFESRLYASLVKVPTLVIVAGNDQVIPRASTEQLYRRFAPGIARMEVIEGAGHDVVLAAPQFDSLLRNFR
ncbi:MAG: alpha/beta fold hydrolase [Ramlibacter sp.]|nr:alpha/beta fold hydrolase [Ramlibacter sp.]